MGLIAGGGGGGRSINNESSEPHLMKDNAVCCGKYGGDDKCVQKFGEET
jgi:hypothetical protein